MRAHSLAWAWAGSFTVGLCLCSASLAQPPTALGDSCYGCHRLSSPASSASADKPQIPALAGYSVLQLRDALLEYRSGTRESTVMGRIARGYSEAELNRIAQQLGAKTGPP